ncbi:cellulose biosynthesis protein BcsD [Caldimonas tepidiphila]|uniref:cellulose biosynthesis protein BcsD n=1 Tax=Caldimonas tepidiphila TaxID=2315841 RepID=UPI000E5B85F4|nr:cellulose biosynthesis protein BcsD [Caldimonas tepidiphila]
MNESIVEYLSEQQCALQWRSFLATLGQTLLERLGPVELRALMQCVGERFAREHPLRGCDTLDDLELALSEVWVGLNWGWATVEETEDCLVIRHQCAPLAAAFGAPALAWSAAFLQGAYQAWLGQLGAGSELAVHPGASDPQGLSLEFQLRR